MPAKTQTQETQTPTPTQLAERFVVFLGNYQPPADLFARDVVVDCRFPHARFTTNGVDEMMEMLTHDSPTGSERVRDVRIDETGRGFLVEFEQTLPGKLVFQELVRGDVENGRIAKLAWYCTGVLQTHQH